MSSLCFSHCNSYGNENYYTFVTSLRQVCINSELQIVKQINMTSSGSYKTFNSYINEVLFTSKTAVAWSCDVTSVWWLVHPQTSWRRWKQSACVATREYRFLPGTRSCQKCFTADLMNDATQMNRNWGRDYDVREFSPHSWKRIWGWWGRILCVTTWLDNLSIFSFALFTSFESLAI